MATEWFVEQADGEIAGPFLEREIADDLFSGKIDSQLRVRQGEQGQWCPAARVRDLFRRLAEQGWYVRSNDGQEYGPFTIEKIGQLLRGEEIASDSLLRQGVGSEWMTTDEVRARLLTKKVESIEANAASPSQVIFRSAKVTSTKSSIRPDPGSKWSTEPPRHDRLPIETVQPAVDLCQPFERLLLAESQDDRQPRILITRSNHAPIGWLGPESSQRLFDNARNGCTHVCLFDQATPNSQVIIIVCPPGTTAENCRDYISEHFASA